jgi:hypothetical protein
MAKRTYRNVEEIIALIQNSESECEDDVHDEGFKIRIKIILRLSNPRGINTIPKTIQNSRK